MARVIPHLPRVLPSSNWNLALLLERQASKRGERLAVLFEDRTYTWREVDQEVNRTARAFLNLGIGRGDTVALLMDNRPEFLFAITALNRIRAAGALINTNVSGGPLAHALRIAEPRLILAGAEHGKKLEDLGHEFGRLCAGEIYIQHDGENTNSDPFLSFDEKLKNESVTPMDPRPQPSAMDRFGFIYTSGTTGLPKAAIITNQRVMGPGALLGRGIFGMTEDDVLYLTTPLYHSVGMYVGWSSALTTGATVALRRRFSASNFWQDVRRFQATVFVYIGELCRYLLNQPPEPLEREHSLRLAGGNGLRPDIWSEFQERFKIPLIREYYGATEGASMCVNMTGKPGMVGRLTPGSAILRCDLESGEPWRDEDGFCQALGPGEIGLLVGPISNVAPFDGYADQEASEKKRLRNVFKTGDCFFNTGDLLQRHPNRWLSFADRVGDTFRWKGENVSTNEVAEIVNRAPGVLESNVYGVRVPFADGRAGMASIHHDANFEIETFGQFVVDSLPSYMRPHFVRLQTQMRITVTFKHQKVGYREEGYDPSRITDPLYLLEGARYIPLDREVYVSLQGGKRRVG